MASGGRNWKKLGFVGQSLHYGGMWWIYEEGIVCCSPAGGGTGSATGRWSGEKNDRLNETRYELPVTYRMKGIDQLLNLNLTIAE